MDRMKAEKHRLVNLDNDCRLCDHRNQLTRWCREHHRRVRNGDLCLAFKPRGR